VRTDKEMTPMIIFIAKQKKMFDKLPKDCILVIFSLLDRKGIDSSVLVCWQWRKFIVNNEMLFKLLCKRLWDVKVPEKRVTLKDWKQAYQIITNLYIYNLQHFKDWTEIETNATTNPILVSDYIYQKGLEKFPESPLFGNYAK